MHASPCRPEVEVDAGQDSGRSQYASDRPVELTPPAGQDGAAVSRRPEGPESFEIITDQVLAAGFRLFPKTTNACLAANREATLRRRPKWARAGRSTRDCGPRADCGYRHSDA